MSRAPTREIQVNSKARTRFLKRTEVLPSGCWKLTTKPLANGYSRFSLDGQSHLGHRVAYAIKHGSTPVDKQLDHLCRNRWCVNWDHVQPVVCQVNLLRSPYTQATLNQKKTHCKHGHEFTKENIYLLKDGSRNCVICRHIRSAKYFNRKAEEMIQKQNGSSR